MAARIKDIWECHVCTLENRGDAKKCAACETKKP